MRIEIDPMPALRAAAEVKINGYFNNQAAQVAQQTAEHATKRAMAQSFVDSGAVLTAFYNAAAIEGMNVTDFAAVILGKEDETMVTANRRRSLVLTARQAQVPADLHVILNEIGLELQSVLT